MSKKRVTLVLDEELDHRVEVFSAMNGVQKNELIATALNEYLQGQKGYAAINRTIREYRSRSNQEGNRRRTATSED